MNKTLANSNVARDKASQIHPHTNLRTFENDGAMIIERGDGVWVYDDQGNRYYEGMSGLWSVALGYGNERLIAAAEKQMRKLAYYQNFMHKSTDPAIELADRLLQIMPVPMSRVMFQSSGSEANDTAVKLCWYYWNGKGKHERRKIIGRLKGYHGTSIATASITALPLLHKDWNLPLPGFIHTDCPHYYRFGLEGETEADFATRCADNLEKLIQAEGPETIAAFFAEPVMGSGGVFVPPATYFEKIQKVLKRHDILFVVDEVITGFGRTGFMWGSQTYDLKPDMISCAKALSSSYLPISALVVSEPIYEVMKAQTDKVGMLGHGYTYGGHPVCAAVALEALNIYEEEDIAGNAARVGAHMQAELRRAFSDHPLIGEVRGVGMMAAMELVRDKPGKLGFDPSLKVSALLSKAAQDVGLMTRPLGDAVVLAPPLISQVEHIDFAIDAYRKAFKVTMDWLAREGHFRG